MNHILDHIVNRWYNIPGNIPGSRYIILYYNIVTILPDNIPGPKFHSISSTF